MLRLVSLFPGAAPGPHPLAQAPVQLLSLCPMHHLSSQGKMGQTQSFLWLWCAARKALCKIALSSACANGHSATVRGTVPEVHWARDVA